VADKVADKYRFQRPFARGLECPICLAPDKPAKKAKKRQQTFLKNPQKTA
jgi:hypothetical protein